MIYQFGQCDLDTDTRELRVKGSRRLLEPQVFDLLRVLIENRNRVLSRDEIFKIVWRGRILSESVLGTRVNAARCAIDDDGMQQRFIRTVRGTGFRFVGEVREQRAAPVTSVTVAIPSGPRLALAFQNAPAIAVLPFVSLSNDEPFADGLTEQVVSSLSRLGWLLVISPWSLPITKGDKSELPRLARKLGARYVLQGSIRNAEGRARIRVHLADQLSGHHVWSECYDRDVSHILTTHDEIAPTIATIVGGELYATEERRIKLKSRQSLAAWECVVGALSLMKARQRQGVGTARALLRRAISIDPKCAPAHALLSFVTTMGVHMGWQSRTNAAPAALHGARTALKFDEDEPWAHVALGYSKIFVTHRAEEAVETLNYALKINPSLAIAHYLIALSFSELGRSELSFAHADMADRFAPYDLLARGNTGAADNVRATACWVGGRYREGIEFARGVIAQSPRQVPAYRAIIINSSLAGDVQSSAAFLQTITGLAPALPQFVRDAKTRFPDPTIYQKYVDGFRMAGLRLS